jgi:hypothetical protein
MKTFVITYTHTVKVEAYVRASSEAEAREQFDKGDTDDELDLDAYDIDILSVKEASDEL